MASNISGHLGYREAQHSEHSRSYVTGVVTKHDCMDSGAVAESAGARSQKYMTSYGYGDIKQQFNLVIVVQGDAGFLQLPVWNTDSD